MTLEFKEVLYWLGVIGVPSIFVMTSYCIRRCIYFTKQLKILSNAQKAQMRSQLLNQYYRHKNKGFITADDLDDWMNQYNAYHTLVGQNGVLTARKDELMSMPSIPN